MKLLRVDCVAALTLVGVTAMMPTIGLAPARQSRVDEAALRAEAEQLHQQLMQATEAGQLVLAEIDRERRVLSGLTEESVARIPLNHRIAMVNDATEAVGLEVIRLAPRRALGGAGGRIGEGVVTGLELSAMGLFPGVVALLESIEGPELALWAEAFEVRSRNDRAGWVTVSIDLAWHADSAGD